MLNTTLTILTWLLLGLTPSLGNAIEYLPDFEATYLISRGGKPTAIQRTTFTRLADNSFRLQDKTEGTHGLAAWTGFERTETSSFVLEGLKIQAINHEMKQDVAFSNKHFKFNAEQNNDLISGQTKKVSFQLNSTTKPISSHMLPWWLSLMVCEGQQLITIPVLKSKNIKTYRFKVTDASTDVIQVDRIYDANSVKSTQVWLDSKMNCFPVKTRHSEQGEPVIETTLEKHNLLPVKANLK